MNPPQSTVEGWRLLGWIGLRALGSTVLIGVAAGLVVSARAGSWRWREVGTVLAQNWELGLMIFCGLVIWDAWFERSRRSTTERKE